MKKKFDKYDKRKKKIAEDLAKLGMTSVSEEDFKRQMLHNRKLGHIEHISQADYDYDFPNE